MNCKYYFKYHNIIVLIVMILPFTIHARPEPPSGYHNRPSHNSLSAVLPTIVPSSYDSPMDSYGPPILPKQPMDSYGPPTLPKDTYGPPTQTAIIHKHVYVHVSPPEPEIEQPAPIIQQPPAQKHYKIVFIKAPSPPKPRAPIIRPPPQNEEKTLVYVLVKKPDDMPPIMIPTPPPPKVNPPEVYFIRYRTKKEGSKSGGYAESIAPASQYGPPSLTYDMPPSH